MNTWRRPAIPPKGEGVDEGVDNDLIGLGLVLAGFKISLIFRGRYFG